MAKRVFSEPSVDLLNVINQDIQSQSIAIAKKSKLLLAVAALEGLLPFQKGFYQSQGCLFIARIHLECTHVRKVY